MFAAPRSLAFSAFRSGGLRQVVVRPSTHARSGWVVVCVFSSPAVAATFARRHAARLGVAVAVRPGCVVSVPCAPPPSKFPGLGFPLVAVGGLRVFCRSLAVGGLR